MSLFPSAHPNVPPRDSEDAVCGWFESSHDLRRGLLVREEMDAVGLALWFKANRARSRSGGSAGVTVAGAAAQGGRAGASRSG